MLRWVAAAGAVDQLRSTGPAIKEEKKNTPLGVGEEAKGVQTRRPTPQATIPAGSTPSAPTGTLQWRSGGEAARSPS